MGINGVRVKFIVSPGADGETAAAINFTLTPFIHLSDLA